MTGEETMSWEEMHANEEILTHERALIGSILISEKCFAEIIDIVTTDDFYTQICADIFAVAHDLYTSGGKVDVIAISAKMQEQGNYEAPGYLREVMLETPTSSNAVMYAEGVRKSSHMRKVKRLLISAADEHKDPDTLTEAVMDGLYGLDRSSSKGKARSIAQGLHSYEASVMEGGTDERLYTGWSRLDKILGGVEPGNLVVLAARPGVGKSAMGAEIALRVAERGIPSVYFSCEMSEKELVQRLIANRARLDHCVVKRGKFKEDKTLLSRYMNARSKMIDKPLFIYDEANITVNTIRRNLQTVRGVGLVVVDYIQLMTSVGKPENRTQEITAITKGLKQIAKEFNVVIIAISQLNRDKTIYDEPIERDLRESGSIEQDADSIIFLWQYEPNPEGILPLICAKVQKNRSGDKHKTAMMRFEGKYISFYETDEDYVPKKTRRKRDFTAYGGHDPDMNF